MEKKKCEYCEGEGWLECDCCGALVECQECDGTGYEDKENAQPTVIAVSLSILPSGKIIVKAGQPNL